MATNYNINNVYTSPAFDSSGNLIVDKRLTVGASVVTAAANNFTVTGGGAVNSNNAGTVTVVDLDVQGDNAIVTWDGSTPSATNGHILYKGNAYSVNYKQWIQMKFIQQNTASTIQASAMQV